ncbi:hypothetical protein FHL15_002289 [Xylaria flabelliformis]|uniref:Uncharacterized protein n=1 Tax=Xylaria flabelliformis TaxID=2512241 RepID=A0A553I9U8_9PEZI|nr:hypothetical protein FHL15_002289 [Xylaria flabelliformis]
MKSLSPLKRSLEKLNIQSFDVLTGKTVVLGDDMAWDEDGKTVIDDSEPESELLDDCSRALSLISMATQLGAAGF